MSKAATPEFDLIVFGATSFVGRLVCAHLADRFAATDATLRWAIAGRSETKLAGVRAEIGRPDMATIVADAHDDAALLNMCQRTRVVITTVGPYALYGEALIRSCAQTGTDYCDLTGEVVWMGQMIERYHDLAVKNGARIVHCCGFDSLPSDLGVWSTQQAAQQQYGAPCTRIATRVKAMRGGFSGGTVASMTNLASELRERPELRRYISDPYSLCPADKRPAVAQPQVKRAQFDSASNAWVAPFVMAMINEHVVHRTQALADYPYGTDFRYDEAVVTGRGARGRARAYALTAAIGGFMTGVSFGPIRQVLERFVLPKPGDGPNAAKRDAGFFDLRFFGETAAGDTVRGKVTGDRDPGYGATSRMIGEAGLCLAFDLPTDTPGGFWTPASLMAKPLIDRLAAHAGVVFSTLDGDPPRA